VALKNAIMTPERMHRMESVIRYRQPDIAVVLENVFDPHNLAAVMRTCDAVGIGEVFAITDAIPKRKNWGYRSSRSANKWVELHAFRDREACIARVQQRYGTILGSSLRAGSSDLYTLSLTGSIAFVFGNEQFGISDEMAAACHGFFRIPQVGMIQSLNVSVACAVTVYEAFRQKSLAGHYAEERLSPAEKMRIIGNWSGNTGDSHGTE
jgi:tRNA (guanosine-2'-O-)-methyltransferase